MADNRDDASHDNRDRKLEGRAKRRRFVQGTRAYTHAMTNSMVKRVEEKSRTRKSEDEPDTREK